MARRKPFRAQSPHHLQGPHPHRLLLFLSAPVLPSSFCRVSLLASSWKRRPSAFLKTSPPFQPHAGIALLLNPSCRETLTGWPAWIFPGLSTTSTKGLEVGEPFVGEKSERKGWVSTGQTVPKFPHHPPVLFKRHRNSWERVGESSKRGDAERNVETLVVFQEKTKGLGENIRRKVLESSLLSCMKLKTFSGCLHQARSLLTGSPEVGLSLHSQQCHEGLGFLFIFSLSHSWSGLYCEVVEDSGVTSTHNSVQGQNEPSLRCEEIPAESPHGSLARIGSHAHF